MKVYLASSWRNPHQPRLVEYLRANGHEVYDFRNPPNKSGFGWEQTGEIRRSPDGKAIVNAREYRDTLAHPIARAGYEADRGGIEWADACVFIAPAGRSASWELGYATALGKIVVLHLVEEMEPELMFFEATIVGSDQEMLAALGGVVLPPDPAMPPPDVIDAMAKDCRSCAQCGEEPPCSTCMALGVCQADCTCDAEDGSDEADEQDCQEDDAAMKCIYVAHPLGQGDDREANRRAAADWAGWIAETFHVAISADWIVLSGVWTEDKREMGLATDMEMISRADEVWQVGPRISPGMALEGDHARKLGKVVRDFTGLTRDELRAVYAEAEDAERHAAQDEEDADRRIGDYDPLACPGCGGGCQVACR